MTGGGHPQQDRRLYIVGTTHVQTNPSPNLISSRETPPTAPNSPSTYSSSTPPKLGQGKSLQIKIISELWNCRAFFLRAVVVSAVGFCWCGGDQCCFQPHKQAEPCCVHSLIWLTFHSSMRVGQQAGTRHRKNPL